jgi:ketosteroid isomerase-like protein
MTHARPTPRRADVVRRLYADIEAGRHGDELRGHFTPDAVTVVRPNALTPTGSTSDLPAMLAASTAGARLLTEQHYDVHDVVEADDLVIVRLRWTGVVAVDAGPLRAGRELTADIAQFVRVSGDRIAEIDTYDCYQPLGPGVRPS